MEKRIVRWSDAQMEQRKGHEMKSETVLTKDHSFAKRLVRMTEPETVQMTVRTTEPQTG